METVYTAPATIATGILKYAPEATLVVNVYTPGPILANVPPDFEPVPPPTDVAVTPVSVYCDVMEFPKLMVPPSATWKLEVGFVTPIPT